MIFRSLALQSVTTQIEIILELYCKKQNDNCHKDFKKMVQYLLLILL